MIEEGKFGTQEAICLTTIAISAKVFFSSPAILAGLVGNVGWYLTIISASTAFLGFFLIYLLLKRFPGKDLIDIFNITLGKLFGFVFSGILALYLLFLSCTRLSEFNEVVKIYIYPETPNWVLVVPYILCVCTASILGLESIARLSKLLIYPMLIGFFTVILLGVQNYNVNYLFPLGGHGIRKTIIEGITRSSVYGEVIILAIFAKSLQGKKFIKKEGFLSIAISAILITLSLLAFSLTFPYYIAQEVTAPMYTMASLIDYGRFLQRVEPVFLFIWIISTLISTAVVYYSFIYLYCKMFNLQDKRPIIIGGSILLFSLSLMHKRASSVIFDNVQTLRNYGSLFIFLPPLLSLIFAFFRKGVKRNE